MLGGGYEWNLLKISSLYINSLTNRKALNNLHLPIEQFEALQATINYLNECT